MRLVKIEGELNGHKFQVKAESLLGVKVDKELREELKEWQEKNNKEWKDFVSANSDAISRGDNLDYPDYNDWRLDVKFRGAYFQKKAETCMKFESKVPKELWESDELEYGTIEEAWDFFMGRRQAPQNSILAR